jgi:DNA mismatch endonuclease, patch repair protein
MADFVSPEKRSKIMRGVKQAHTQPELLVRRALHSRGYRFRLHRKDLPGRPDIVLPKYKLAIFVHGCFWHQHAGCKDGRLPTSNEAYWTPKLKRNKERDLEKAAALKAAGWQVANIWECETRAPAVLATTLDRILPLRRSLHRIPGESAWTGP